MDSIYFDNEPQIGINVYFPWGHHFLRIKLNSTSSCTSTTVVMLIN